MRAPLVATLIAGVLIAGVGNLIAVTLTRTLPYSARAQDTNLYLEQTGLDGPYVLHADLAAEKGRVLSGVMLFATGSETRERIAAQTARLVDGAWVLEDATRYVPGRAPEKLRELLVPTRTTAGDMQLTTTVLSDPTPLELLAAAGRNIADPVLRAAALTSLIRVAAFPLLLCGSVLMGFAFTSGYRRTNKLGGAVLYGLVLGFVVYVVSELAIQSGVAGVVDPAFAAIGPAGLAIVIGLTVLLFREDGRA